MEQKFPLNFDPNFVARRLQEVRRGLPIMKPIAVFYATREGQTKRIAEHVAGKLRGRGFQTEMHNLRDPEVDIDLLHYSAAVLASSAHAGEHATEMVHFVKQNLGQLDQLPTAFLSITLSEAGVERRDATSEEHARFAADVQKMIEHFFEETGWHPTLVKPVAGALLYSKYSILIRFVMKRIAARVGAPTDTSRDYEYTDWEGLDHFVDEFTREVGSEPVTPSAHM
jgi:menaquinone-dependent protoporphyrinogen oxidase